MKLTGPFLFSSIWIFILGNIDTLNGAVVFEQSLTGSELFDLGGSVVDFTEGVGASVNGTSLDLDPSGNEQILFSWEILTPSSRKNLIFTVTVDYTPQTGDNDPVFMISDGTNAVGFVRMDSGTIHAQSYRDNATGISGRTETSNIISGLGSVDPFTFQVLLEDDSTGSSLIDYTEGEASTTEGTSVSYSRALDTDQSLYFILASSSVARNELYQLNSITITVTSDNEPSGWTWSDALQTWVYIPDERTSIEGGWTYLPVIPGIE